MLKGLMLTCSAVMLGASFAAAGRIDFDQGVDVKGIVQEIRPEAIQASKTPRAGLAEWTIMVYVNGKNNLESYGLKNINQMEMVGSTDKVKIAVEFGRYGNSSDDGAWMGQRRYLIQKDSDPNHISSPVLQAIPKADMGDWHHLADFAAWAKRNAPAKHYMLIVWNHGSGWLKHASKDIWTRGISYDDETGHHMSTPEIGQALAAIGKVDIYASDACLMQMAEVGYQIKDYADYLVQSEEVEPADGYTYDALLAPLAAKPSMGAAELARITAQTYTAHYAGSGTGATQSSVKAAALPGLISLASSWAQAVMTANEPAVVASARSQAQHFYYPENKDLLDFVQLVDGKTKDAAVKSRGAALEKYLTGEVILYNAATGDQYQRALGIAVYVPSGVYNIDYDELAWAKDGSWSKFDKWVQDIPDSAGGGDGGGGGGGGSAQASPAPLRR